MHGHRWHSHESPVVGKSVVRTRAACTEPASARLAHPGTYCTVRWGVDDLKKLANRHAELSCHDFSTLAETIGPTAFSAPEIDIAISVRKVLAFVAVKTVAVVD